MDIKKAVLFVNIQKNKALAAAEKIQRELIAKNIETTVFSFQGKPEKPPEGKWDIAFSLGGDGTVLYTARCLADSQTPILPVNLGTLGFIAGVVFDEWLDIFERWKNGKLNISRRCMLKVSVERSGETIINGTCLNDAVISATGIAKLIKLNVQSIAAGGEQTELGFYRCDGLIVATPTGSTAYSMAAGGPILDPEMEAVILNPICPFTLSNRPLVLPSQLTLAVTVAREQRSGVLLTIDGQDIFSLECGDRILIQQAPWEALLIFADRHAYYSALLSKLSWAGGAGGGAGDA
ncbi:MAG: NAD(+)/NADH kinase [Treponema sp.]|nr:NAD(+)/NADH kinase [Treponema sp.]